MFASLNPVPSFPTYRGPLTVGTAEYEIPISELPSTSKVPDPEITTIKFRIFYPTESAAQNDDNYNTVPWLPEPQREWLNAYIEFMNAPHHMSKFFSYLPVPLKYTTIPAHRNASLLPPKGTAEHWPVLVFSHGLGGSCNAYSHLLGSLASCGVICVAPEHRDQSTPISIIRHADGSRKSIRYKRLSHEPSPEVLSGRNAQLRIRLWELELLYTALTSLNIGTNLTNLAAEPTPSFHNKLDLRPSKVTWAGHSFGAATVVQFVKSVFWHQTVTTPNGDSRSRPIFEILYTPAQNSALTQQITPDSALVLLDLWTLPLRGETTLWLWEKPLPCFVGNKSTQSNVLSIMSEEFFKWTTLLDRVKAILSPNPAEREKTGTVHAPPSSGPRLFYAPKSAHLSQSDFGVLLPWATKKWLGAEEPERTLLYNTRAILQLLRENGISVESMRIDEHGDREQPAMEDAAILAKDGNLQGWIPVPID